MSHFKTLVIGEDVDGQLEPFDENARVPAYRDEDWNYAESLRRAKQFYAENPQYLDVTTASDHDIVERFHEGENLRWNEDKTEAERWSTYNPHSKWDYWQVGGRYNCTFLIKPDANPDDWTPSERHWSEEFGNDAKHSALTSDKALKRAIDFDAMIARNVAEAEMHWDQMARATEGIEPPAEDWDTVREVRFPGDIDAARRYWNNHPWNMATRRESFLNAYDYFNMGAEDPHALTVAKAADWAVSGYYAVVHEGAWIASGRMGWFGMSSDEVDEAAWRKSVRDLVESLPGDTMLTVVDCHI